jgi:predicted enzyme related to lactoylglutathione lyase
MEDLVVWNSIPVSDLDRACTFYSHVLGLPLDTPPGMDGVALPGRPPGADESQAPSRIVAFNLYLGGEPGAAGPTVWLSSLGDIDGMLERVREAGGTIDQDKQYQGEMIGWTAFFIDSEANRIGIRQMQLGGLSHNG